MGEGLEKEIQKLRMTLSSFMYGWNDLAQRKKNWWEFNPSQPLQERLQLALLAGVLFPLFLWEEARGREHEYESSKPIMGMVIGNVIASIFCFKRWPDPTRLINRRPPSSRRKINLQELCLYDLKLKSSDSTTWEVTATQESLAQRRFT